MREGVVGSDNGRVRFRSLQCLMWAAECKEHYYGEKRVLWEAAPLLSAGS